MSFIISEEFRVSYPETYKRIKKYINHLYVLNEFARDKVFTDNFSDNNQNALFFGSIKHLAGLCNYKSIDKFNIRLGILCYVGLIKKLANDEIPEFLLREAYRQKKLKGQNQRVSYFSIPSYSEATLKFSESKAKEFKEMKFTVKGFGRELLVRSFGKSEADRVYPQLKGRKISELNETISQGIESIAIKLIKEKGWTTEEEILENVILYFRGQNRYKHIQIKRMLPEMLDKYNFKKAPLNKELKTRFGIDQKERFSIIYF